MEYFLIFAQDKENVLEKRLEVRPQHLARLEQLKAEGRLLTAGPTPTFDGSGVTGSLVIAKFPSLQDAENWLQADPYVEAQVYAEAVIKPFRKVF